MNDELDDELDQAVGGLRMLRRRLGRIGVVTFVATALHVVVLLLRFVGLLYFLWAVLASLSLFVVASATALWFETLRRRGDALYDEISDEVQWHIGREYASSINQPVSEAPRPPLRYRIELRSFAKASDLPLAPGRFGPAVYVALNVTLVVLLVIRNYGPRGGF